MILQFEIEIKSEIEIEFEIFMKSEMRSATINTILIKQQLKFKRSS